MTGFEPWNSGFGSYCDSLPLIPWPIVDGYSYFTLMRQLVVGSIYYFDKINNCSTPNPFQTPVNSRYSFIIEP